MGIRGSAHDGVAGIDAAAGKKVNSGSPPRRGERIEETARVIGGRRPRCVRGGAEMAKAAKSSFSRVNARPSQFYHEPIGRGRR